MGDAVGKRAACTRRQYKIIDTATSGDYSGMGFNYTLKKCIINSDNAVSTSSVPTRTTVLAEYRIMEIETRRNAVSSSPVMGSCCCSQLFMNYQLRQMYHKIVPSRDRLQYILV